MDKVPLHNLAGSLEHKILFNIQKLTSSVMTFHPFQGYTEWKKSWASVHLAKVLRTLQHPNWGWSQTFLLKGPLFTSQLEELLLMSHLQEQCSWFPFVFLELLFLGSLMWNSLPALDHLIFVEYLWNHYYYNYTGLFQTSLIQTLDIPPEFSFNLPTFLCGWHDCFSFLVVLTLNFCLIFFVNTFIHTSYVSM